MAKATSRTLPSCPVKFSSSSPVAASHIRAVARGEALFGPAIAARLSNFFNPPQPVNAAFPELTAREFEVLNLLAQGKNNQEIAGQLVISKKTVRNHLSNIFSKLQVADRVQAIIRAREAGMGTTNSQR